MRCRHAALTAVADAESVVLFHLPKGPRDGASTRMENSELGRYLSSYVFKCGDSSLTLTILEINSKAELQLSLATFPSFARSRRNDGPQALRLLHALHCRLWQFTDFSRLIITSQEPYSMQG